MNTSIYWELTCDRLMSHPGVVNLLICFTYRKRRKALTPWATWLIKDLLTTKVREKIGQRQEWQRTIALINENKSCTLEYSVLISCLLLSSLINHGKITFGILLTM